MISFRIRLHYVLQGFVFVSFVLSSFSCRERIYSAVNDSGQFEWEVRTPLTDPEKLLAQSADTFFQNKVKLAGLNGSVLVAKHNKIIYQKSFGYADYKGKKMLNDSSTFQLASVSKPFTATAILLLAERGELDLDDPVSKYISGFPYSNISIRCLLNHRSGLANYIYLFDTLKLPADTLLTNADVVGFFNQNQPALQATPDHKFQYCNTNYALLEYIVEQVSGENFSDFLREHIFIPAHMYSSYLKSPVDTTHHLNETVSSRGSKWETMQRVPYDGVMGDKGIYSTPYDLFLFDQALNHGLLLKQETLEQAYKGYSYEKPGIKNYGLGWRLKEFPDSTRIIYHNGWWRGSCTLFLRKPESGISIIILSNKFNRSVYNVGSLCDLLGVNDGISDDTLE